MQDVCLDQSKQIDPLENLVWVIERFWRLHRLEVFGDLELRYTDLSVLECLGRLDLGKETIISDLVEQLGLRVGLAKQSTVSQCVTRLEKRGLVQRRWQKGSKRFPIALTSEGRTVVEKLHQATQAVLPELLNLMHIAAGTDRSLGSLLARGIGKCCEWGFHLANVARVYDSLLGGEYPLSVADRTAKSALCESVPRAQDAAIANRAFLRRAVCFLADHEITQWLDIGSGLPTAGSTMQLLEELSRPAHVVFVDKDEYAVNMAEAYLERQADLALSRSSSQQIRAQAIPADLQNPEKLLSAVRATELVDFRRPVGVLLCAVLHFIVDDAKAYDAVRAIKAALAPGSYLVISHVTMSGRKGAVARRGARCYSQIVSPLKLRSKKQIADFFEGTELDGGAVQYIYEWRPEIKDGWLAKNNWDVRGTTDKSDPQFMGGVARITEANTASLPQA